MIPSSLFILASSVCKSLQCLISALTQGGKGGHLFSEQTEQTCSVVLWGGRNTTNKYFWHVWRVLVVDGPHWVCHSPRLCVLPGSTLLRLQDILQGCCLKWPLHFVNFPGLSHSGSPVLHKGTDPVGCEFCALPRSKPSGNQVLGEHTLSGGSCILYTSPVPAAWFPGCATRAQSQVCCVCFLGS